MASNNIYRVTEFFVFEHSLRYAPCADCLTVNYLYFREVVWRAAVTFEMPGKIYRPVGVVCAFVSCGADIVKLQTVSLVSRDQRFAVPFITRGINVLRVRHPARLAPPEHIEGYIRVDLLRVGCELKSRAAGNVRLFVRGAHSRRLRAGGRIDVRAHFHLDMRYIETVLAEQIIQYFAIPLRLFALIIEQETRRIVCADEPETLVQCVFRK